MDIDEYQEMTRETAVYPSDGDTDINYIALGLNDESGEVAGAMKKYLRGDFGEEEMKSRVRGEAGDVLWYWARLLDELDIEASEIIEENSDKVQGRKQRGTIRGDGHER
jgi:MazG nucleotide pyrophosphohydrolase domain.